ncbi:hypothetical protein [Phytoactinopolyspora mesophila]|uniref:Uncharacterized protein n=1 Tax=Phytoactinopolyspora mesophila TaxID=2650750 RepID=A0A7K3LZ01_9ACTN|nr:hypothetical protein [Phytoactinopolyspora mesophila]NDL56229.1 hypothetical protein [Phytoactinopolyspora mesophila]
MGSKMRLSRLRVATIPLAILLCINLASMGASGTSEEPGEELGKREQIPGAHPAEAVDDLSDHLHESLERLGYAENAGIEADYQRGKVYLYWKDELPRSLLGEIRRLENNERIEIKSAQYSAAEIDAEIRRIFAETPGFREAIATIGPADDYSHILIQPKPGRAPQIAIESEIPIEVTAPTDVEEARAAH